MVSEVLDDVMAKQLFFDVFFACGERTIPEDLLGIAAQTKILF
jgi:hypothetical protein